MEGRLSWGNYPKFKIKSKKPFNGKISFNEKFIPYGNGRSYGDSCINHNLVDFKSHNKIIHFDKVGGNIHVQSGILLEEIIKIIVPQGWFLKVSPGSKYVTVGGAIASDVHGKNHHIEGCFSESIDFFKLMLPNGKILKCSKNINKEYFYTTCGGMGLTGVILEAKIKLLKIKSSYINKTTIKAANLKECFKIFESIGDKHYSAAWIDSMAKGRNIGRSIIQYGEFDDDGDFTYKNKKALNIPFYFPNFFLNSFTIKLFNFCYYEKVRKKISFKKVCLNSFLFPLDSISNWTRIYGKGGFLQYQFIIPKNNSYSGIMSVLDEISRSNTGSFLGVLKLHGKSNKNYLSFPMEGYSLALDFRANEKNLCLLKKLDKIISHYNGRIYLSKDARVSKEVFEKGYSKITEFRNFRDKHKLKELISSLQSERLEI